MRFSPGCRCCRPGPCLLFQDDFNRPDDTTPGGRWNPDGTWEIVDQRLAGRAAGATCIHVKEHSDSHVRLTCSIHGQAGDRARMILNYQDADNYHFMEIRFGADGYTQLTRREAGVDTILQQNNHPNWIADTFHAAVFCFKAGVLSGGRISNIFLETADGNVTGQVAIDNETLASGFYGLGTGATVSDVRFENFRAVDSNEIHPLGSPCAICVPLVPCRYGHGAPRRPKAFAIDIDGLKDNFFCGPFGCSGCKFCETQVDGFGPVNGIYEAQLCELCGASGGGRCCTWQLEQQFGCFGKLRLVACPEFIRVDFDNHIVWKKDYSSPPDLMNLIDEEIPFFEQTVLGPISPFLCSPQDSTCHVTTSIQ